MEKIIAFPLRVVMRFIWVKVCKSIQNNVWQKVSLFSVSFSVVSNSLRPHGLYPARLLWSWNSPGKNTGVGRHSLLQGIFPAQGLNPGLPHCRQILYLLSHLGSPREILYPTNLPSPAVSTYCLVSISISTCINALLPPFLFIFSSFLTWTTTTVS